MPSKFCSLKPLIPFYTQARPLQWQDVFPHQAPLVVEIGFGMGEVMLRNAQKQEQQNYLGIEQHWERIYKTMKAIDRASLQRDNIRILDLDARIAFDRIFEQESIDHIYCLFPCPWPKKSHVKHRLFSRSFLQLLNSRLKMGSQIYFVTDYKPYYQWVIDEVDQDYFTVETSLIKPQFDTKFERKWVEGGQQEFYELVLTKKKHFKREVTRDKEMKHYAVDHFDPETFSFENVKGKISIVAKDQMYDPKQKRFKIMLIVSEEQMTQYFWATIIYKEDRWRIYKSEGQFFFCTPGIVQALDEVYQQAKKALNAA